ncbi:Do family serine endopeptidase [Microvirga arsenatis]|uniref:Do family serine endopeptidase n=1 Tax=Microvirga arsenatis TaxID=2692265 RepID=A0ABW9Z1Y2_9HYPH|nr:Do family serine endopeptidase [Microvirga arsenatis]NBJ12341.1 Do family serine endopeptidase [Microvirga arsenatis]NBJ26132.1 Do family serine endopeptidase [Microvirga arsenatis]
MRMLPFRLSIAAIALALGYAGAQAQTQRVVPESKAQVQLSFAPIVRQTANAVVNVYAKRSERRQNAAIEEYFRRFFGDSAPGIPRGRSQSSLGSGVIVDPSGLVITNNHVIENMNEVKVALTDRREFEADIVLRDPRTDIAVLKLKDAANLQAVELGDSEALQVGDIVLAIGNPFGVGQTVTQGIVSALARTQVGISDYQFFIQTDAAINPGNSGGALIDMNGRVVGINTAIYSRSGGSIGIGFAVPSSMVRVVLNSARGGAKNVVRPWLGARLQQVDGDIASGLGLERPTGVLVTAVYDKGPAAQAGLKRGDAILAVDGQPVDNPDSFGYRFTLKGTQGQTPLTVLRGGKQMNIQVRLMPPPEDPPRDPVRSRGRTPFAGATLVNMSPAVADELQIDIADDGVVIADLEERSVAASVGFEKGDQIVAINGERLANTKDADRLINRNGGYWEITVNRGGRVFTTVLGR